MKKIALSLCILISVAVNAQSTWKVDESHSSINFSVSHLIISETTGSFDAFDVTAVTETDFENPQFNVSIETASINTKNSDRDDHLKADDFLMRLNSLPSFLKVKASRKPGRKLSKYLEASPLRGLPKKYCLKEN